jgi:hypothetical protein
MRKSSALFQIELTLASVGFAFGLSGGSFAKWVGCVGELSPALILNILNLRCKETINKINN